MEAIEVTGLRKTYKDREAVAGVDLVVARGEIFALLGPNGAGKTTTVEILEGHRRRTSGDVRVLGEDPGKAGSAWRSRIGIVLQDADDAADLTVREMVRHLGGFYPDARPADEVIELVGLTAKRNSKIRTLSGGQRRRVDVALGIVGRPELLFLDEPTTGFDPEARRQFWDLIRHLAGDGTTIVLTTHYLDEAEALADRLVVLAGGLIVAEGTPATLGGRSAAAARVRWREDGVLHEEQHEDPTELIRRLVATGADLTTLTISRPTLEDIYLSLIGATR
ncbi:putative ABC transporter ATP-binding protein [Actinoplanes missouriensis 431]|uniref:Putative ABC transporter ATP-binding protein n=1 Tax=Actinoplanes missouriensis (strain ATCC 14538 / DSM 43046 / CBS 188.64 / JCM 3121 / NBRC 102363 / NCIMB 12654 / NRRL B-3342 / UNCC 431) TaxID=512565 RepID=I0HFQ3_ACTM4|nr:ABC transporter ATP-binding protein [Actinoplanes missouriensis]BAL91840.1 putative ABC transporter ATP-binding protein [Actinoplanes missouriensis 431]